MSLHPPGRNLARTKSSPPSARAAWMRRRWLHYKSPPRFCARTVEKVLGVHLLEFGIPEAMWHLRVRDFGAIVTMDAHGNGLTRRYRARNGREASGTAANVAFC